MAVLNLQLLSRITQQFLKTWAVEYRVSSVYFLQSNDRAEVAVRVTYVSLSGNLNIDLFLRALLQLCDTPIPDCDLFSAKIVFGHPLRDAFSFSNH